MTKQPIMASQDRQFRRLKERLIEIFFLISGLTSIVLIGLIFLFLFKEGLLAFREIHLAQFIGTYVEDFFTGQQVFRYIWQPVSTEPKYSLVPLINGSILVALPATLIASIFGLGIGIYLSEVASSHVREIVKPFIELLAGIPTVVIGFVMLAIVATYLQHAFGTKFRLNAFVGALGVSLVIIPLIASIVEDSLRAVPNDLREAAYGLGATQWQTIWRIVLPAGISGVTAAMILGFGRALGETMIVVMATGNGAVVTGNIFSTVRTMTATIASELGAVAHGSGQYYALFFVGAVLFTITFVFNLIAEIVVERMRRKLRML